MQDNVITLAVDVANNDVLVNAVFTREDFTSNKSTYHGPLYSMTHPDILNFRRSPVHPTSVNKGITKVGIKLSKGMDVEGADGVSEVTLAMIADINFHIPVGVTAADSKEFRMRMAAVLMDDSIMDKLFSSQSI